VKDILSAVYRRLFVRIKITSIIIGETGRDDTVNRQIIARNTRAAAACVWSKLVHRNGARGTFAAKSISMQRERFPGWLSGKYCFALGLLAC
jgi:hypothetical protein